jgi:3-hydroxyacyl-CoA dehydrogenase/enoyl-CoA hydratase/3-hydroxybutyryl-CoA epimerase
MTEQLLMSISELNAGARRPLHIPASKLEKIGILGSGFMGAGIASVTVQAGFDVTLIDLDQAAAERGKARCEALILERVSKGQSVLAEAAASLSHIQASADYADLADCDLVIESVFEDREAKTEAIQKAQVMAGENAIFASNTSIFPISILAKAFERPANFIGLHFFSPVEKMHLVEVIKGEKTSDRTLAVAFDFVRAIGKTPIVVNDAYEFFTSRCVNAYLREGHLMLLEDVPPDLIESTARAAGMRVGPLALSDEVAIDLVYKIVLAMKTDLGPDLIEPKQEKLLRAMVVEHGRYGRKNRKGFYDYPEFAPKSLWPGLDDLQPVKRDGEAIDKEDLKARFLVIQALEAVRSFEQGIVTDPREADAGSVLGFGFPAATGGVLAYVDDMGARAFLSLCERLCAAYGRRFAPPALLKDLARTGDNFYGRFAKTK